MSAIFTLVSSFFQNLVGKEVKKIMRQMVFTLSAVSFLLLGVVFCLVGFG